MLTAGIGDNGRLLSRLVLILCPSQATMSGERAHRCDDLSGSRITTSSHTIDAVPLQYCAPQSAVLGANVRFRQLMLTIAMHKCSLLCLQQADPALHKSCWCMVPGTSNGLLTNDSGTAGITDAVVQQGGGVVTLKLHQVHALCALYLQIEPVQPWVDAATGTAYKDYGDEGPYLYMKITKECACGFIESRCKWLSRSSSDQLTGSSAHSSNVASSNNSSKRSMQAPDQQEHSEL